MARTSRLLAIILAALFVLGLAASVWGAWYSEDWTGLVVNLGTEMVGAVVVYVLLKLVVGGQARKRKLMAQLGSTVSDVALAAAEDLRRQGWLTDGSLQSANLMGANLMRANLCDANLEHAWLTYANLELANLMGANLMRANLEHANLGANLMRAIT